MSTSCSAAAAEASADMLVRGCGLLCNCWFVTCQYLASLARRSPLLGSAKARMFQAARVRTWRGHPQTGVPRSTDGCESLVGNGAPRRLLAWGHGGVL